MIPTVSYDIIVGQRRQPTVEVVSMARVLVVVSITRRSTLRLLWNNRQYYTRNYDMSFFNSVKAVTGYEVYIPAVSVTSSEHRVQRRSIA